MIVSKFTDFRRLEAANVKTRYTVHDEVVASCPRGQEARCAEVMRALPAKLRFIAPASVKHYEKLRNNYLLFWNRCHIMGKMPKFRQKR